MLDLQHIKLNIANVDISGMVLNINILETIKGGVKGSIVVKDNLNFYDTFIGHIQPAITLTITYLGATLTNTFVADGISDMKIIKLGKTYTIHFISLPTMLLSIETLNYVYSGTSDKILTKMWLQTCGNALPLSIDTDAITKGKYVVPNINAGKAIMNVVNASYDIQSSPFCLYQRFWDGGVTRLTTLHDMNKNSFKGSEGNTIAITEHIVSSADNQSNLNTVGTSSNFVLEDMQRHFAKKVGLGHWGKKLSHIKLDQSAVDNLEQRDVTGIHVTGYKLSDKLYDNSEKSLFNTLIDPASSAAKNQKARVYNQYMKVSDVISVPYLGVGFSVDIDQGGSNISRSRMDNHYIVAQINHKFILDDGNMKYGQDLGLIRE
tara:strand:- start:522 stop:1652 length:1131 start_codon:yes stop_codon:yes gene_type:complete